MNKTNCKQVEKEIRIDLEYVIREETYVVQDKGKIEYSTGRNYNFSDPKEKVRLEYYFDLIEKYMYPADRIEFEIAIPKKTMPMEYADIVVFTNDEERSPYIVVKCERSDISKREFNMAMKQVIRNARLLKARFAVCAAGNVRHVVDVCRFDDKFPNKSAVADIPVCYRDAC